MINGNQGTYSLQWNPNHPAYGRIILVYWQVLPVLNHIHETPEHRSQTTLTLHWSGKVSKLTRTNVRSSHERGNSQFGTHHLKSPNIPCLEVARLQHHATSAGSWWMWYITFTILQSLASKSITKNTKVRWYWHQKIVFHINVCWGIFT